MNKQITVSVVIPAFNSAATLPRAIDSALTQTYPAHEIMVVDDCSTDATREIAGGYADRGVKLLSLPARKGAAGARNAGIGASTGEAVAFLDADDEWLSPKIAAQIKILTLSPRIAFVACASNIFSPTGADLGDTFGGCPISVGPECWRSLLARNYVSTPTIVAWRRHIMAAGCFDENLKVAEDQDLWIKLSLLGDLCYVPQSLVKIYELPNSLSTKDRADAIKYTLPMIERHIAELGSRLSGAEIRKIRGERMGLVGRNVYSKGDIRNGLRLIGRSMLLGYRPLEGLQYMASASPPGRWLKQQLGISQTS